jgi:hypothetical protein
MFDLWFWVIFVSCLSRGPPGHFFGLAFAGRFVWFFLVAVSWFVRSHSLKGDF